MEYTPLKYDDFKKFCVSKTVSENFPKGLAYKFLFPNEYGASVIKNETSYGHDCDLFELMILHKGNPCYTTSITEDVIGYLSNDKVLEVLSIISSREKEEKL